MPLIHTGDVPLTLAMLAPGLTVIDWNADTVPAQPPVIV